MQISFVMLIFLLFSNQFFFFWGGGGGQIGGKLLKGKSSSQPNNVSKHRNDRVVLKGSPNKFLYCMSYYNYKYVENIKTRINFLDKRQTS